MNQAPAVGIDLGTTYSCATIFQHGTVEIIANEQGNRTTPSVVSFNEFERLIGEVADDESIKNPTNTLFGEINPYTPNKKIIIERLPKYQF